jgi:hypothetical protein
MTFKKVRNNKIIAVRDKKITLAGDKDKSMTDLHSFLRIGNEVKSSSHKK